MNITQRQMKLLNFMVENHIERRKYNGEPYWFHLARVAMQAEKLYIPFAFEKGISHDSVEDIEGFEFADLTKLLEECGYNKDETDKIVTSVYHLTDVYTSKAYPSLNRLERKKLEAERLWLIPVDDQTLKYCDLDDNTSTIVPYDADFAKVYMKEKEYILQGMNQGNQVLYKLLWERTYNFNRRIMVDSSGSLSV